MKKLFLNTLIPVSLLFSSAIAQEIDFANLGNFDNLKTVIDPATKKERAMTDQEVKEKVTKEINFRLEGLQSTRQVDVSRIAVLPGFVSVPLVEWNGTPFYVLTIDRATGLSGDALAQKPYRDRLKYDAEKWQRAYDEQEKRRDNSAKAVEEYRKKNPKKHQELKTRLPEQVYKPKAPARKIVPKQ